MRAIRWTGDRDRYFGPFTYARERGAQTAALVLCSGEEDYPGCSLRLTLWGHTLIAALPPVITPARSKVMAPSWDAATVQRLGRNWYCDVHRREYGLYLSEGGYFRVLLGAQTHDSTTTKSWSCFVPWLNWRFHRFALYGINGEVVWSGIERKGGAGWKARQQAEAACPKAQFDFIDYDGERLTAATLINEREWRFGTTWCSWLSWFGKPKIRRSLDITYSGEVGSKKGSWKGGTIGTGIEMFPVELHEAAFRRHCEKERLTFVGRRFDAVGATS